MTTKFNQKEWFSAVYLAKALLELPSRPDFDISDDDLKAAAHDYLSGLIARHDGGIPTLSEKTRQITALIQAGAMIEVLKNGGGLQ